MLLLKKLVCQKFYEKYKDNENLSFYFSWESFIVGTLKENEKRVAFLKPVSLAFPRPVAFSWVLCMHFEMDFHFYFFSFSNLTIGFIFFLSDASIENLTDFRNQNFSIDARERGY